MTEGKDLDDCICNHCFSCHEGMEVKCMNPEHFRQVSEWHRMTDSRTQQSYLYHYHYECYHCDCKEFKRKE